MKYFGSCMCKAVAYECETEPRKFYFCHCEQCRKLSGSAHAANVLAEPAPIRWLRGEELVRRFDEPAGRQFTRVFCLRCGSGLPFINLSGTSLIIPAGGLDSPTGIEVTDNIFWSEVPDWYETGTRAPRRSKFPR